MQTFSIDEHNIRVRRGERFCLTAPAVPTAGYRWRVQSDTPAVVEVKSTFENTSSGIGGSAVQRIIFEAREIGAVRIPLAYAQAGATVPEEVREFEIYVTG